MRSRIDLTAAAWRKSSYSNADGGSCVEVADGYPGVLPVRDSKVSAGPALVVRTEAWAPFVTAIANETLSEA
ncbi:MULTISPECIES: DUF397 domain-containing protein [unclassified Streptomyces]|uniref:DUF397 domain-containing protein n=1 Tax=unclassified Streptomyces TaxID=2593676 RepID=UPI000CD5952E|nr:MULTISPECIES: DUF397 domain-containing protein [unclassified Streptomyces]